jgi:hypothetical protein
MWDTDFVHHARLAIQFPIKTAQTFVEVWMECSDERLPMSITALYSAGGPVFDIRCSVRRQAIVDGAECGASEGEESIGEVQGIVSDAADEHGT